ncbi:alpha/beta fold hydrolase [Hephaestia mangrovi]|uniref:alpha/beta fold hydrolase n=1 Tax=Hephaestia mangrovi TaxID=2873268 RepID=UPI001CA67272|nr:alpha/beta hydrolase [Hephaestia mangrovi]MBY8829016.1 alpha/beta hydrolase [Hephaestia mangrovi]
MTDSPRLAHHRTAGASPTVVFLPGYASDMSGTKAVALEIWARETGRAFLRFDYRGCGESPGAFEDFTLADWRDDALAMLDTITGPAVLVGSSMGGWLMLLAAIARPEKVAGLVGIAPAPDFTDWGFTDAQKRDFAAHGRVLEESPYSDQPTVTTRAFWEAGERLHVLDGEIAYDGPVRIVQGQADRDVPWARAPLIAGALRSADVQTWLVKDGDHRMSRACDIALIIRAIEDVLACS